MINSKQENSICEKEQLTDTEITELHKEIDLIQSCITRMADNSIPVHDTLNMDKTYSPWIYSEIICTQIVRNKPLIAYRDYSVLAHGVFEMYFSESVNRSKINKISYTVSLAHLLKLDETALEKWKEKKEAYCNESEDKYQYALDFLYKIKCPSELEIAKKTSEVISFDECRIIREFYKKIAVNVQERQTANYNRV